MKVKTAKGPIAWYLRRCGFYGWASFWRTVYVLPGLQLRADSNTEICATWRLPP